MTITLPDPEELYDSPVGHRTTGFTRRQFFKKAAMSIGAVVIAASSLSLFNACAPPSSQPPVIQPATISPEKSYRDRVREALLQDVPELADYRNALEYTTQRMVDIKAIRGRARERGVDYGTSFEQIRTPLTKWVQANIDWGKKEERLIGFNNNPDFLSRYLFGENGTFNFAVAEQNGKIAAAARLNGKRVPEEQLFASNIESIISGHDQIWVDIHSPEKMEKYLTIDIAKPLPFTAVEASKYKKAVRDYGTYEDIAHWALVGKASVHSAGKTNEELARNEVPLAMILAVGGDARIEMNEQLWDISAYKGTAKMRSDPGDRQLAFKISDKLKREIADRLEEFGKPLDPDYLAPNLPGYNAIEKASGWVSPISGVKLIGITAVSFTSGDGTQKYLYRKPYTNN